LKIKISKKLMLTTQPNEHKEVLVQSMEKKSAEEIENPHDGHLYYYLNLLIHDDHKQSEKLPCSLIDINPDLKAARA